MDRQKVIDNAQKLASRSQYDKAIAEYRRILKEDPNDVRIMLKIGDLQVRKQDRAEAIATYSRVAAVYDQQGFFLKAIAVYKQVLSIDPNVNELYTRLAALYVKQGLLPDALAHLDTLAARYARAGMDDKVVGVYRQMVQIDAASVPGHIKLAELLSRLNRHEEAAQEFQVGATLLKDAGRFDDWAKVAERLLFHRPEDVVLAKAIARHYLERQDAKRSLPKLQLCFKHNPRDIETLELLALAFRELGQVPKTISVLKEIARIYGEMGMPERRVATWRRVLELSPSDPEAREAVATPAIAHPSAPSNLATASRPGNVPPSSVATASRPGRVPAEAPPPAAVIPAPVAAPPAPAPAPIAAPAPVAAFVPAQQSSALPMRSAAVVATAPAIPSAVARANAPRVSLQRSPDDERDLLGGSVPAPTAARAPTAASTPASVPPEPANDATKAIAEAEIFLKYGLKQKAIAHLERALESHPDSIALHTRMREIHAEIGDTAGTVRHGLRLATLLAGTDPNGARDEIRGVLALDATHPAARALAERLGALAPLEARGPAPAPVPAPDGGGHREDDIVVDDDLAIDESVSVSDEDDDAVISVDDDVIEISDDDDVMLVDDDEDQEIYEERRDTTPPPAAAAMPPASASAIATVSDRPSRASMRPSSRPGVPTDIAEGLDEVDFYLSQGLYGEAREGLQSLLAVHHDNPELLRRFADLEALENSSASALGASISPEASADDRTFALAEKLAEEVDAAQAGGAQFNDGGEMIDVETVFAQFKKGIDQTVDADDAETHYDLGIAYREMGLVDDAIREFEVAARGAQRTTLAETMIGLCYLEQDLAGPAIEHFQRALATTTRGEREEMGLFFELGNAYEAIGDTAEALAYYRKAAGRDSSFRNVSERIERLMTNVSSDDAPQQDPELDEVDRAFDLLMKG